MALNGNKWQCSIAMFVYRRICSFLRSIRKIGGHHCWLLGNWCQRLRPDPRYFERDVIRIRELHHKDLDFIGVMIFFGDSIGVNDD